MTRGKRPDDSRNPVSSLPDVELIHRARDGDRDAYGELTVRHSDFVYGLVYGLLGHREDALELVQTVFLRAFVRLKTLREPERFRSWLGLVATSQAKNRLRGRREVPTDTLPERQARDPGPLRAMIEAEERQRLRQALARIPAKNRTVLVLRYQSGLSYQEIAAELDLPPSTVRSRIYEGKQMLRAFLDAGNPERVIRDVQNER